MTAMLLEPRAFALAGLGILAVLLASAAWHDVRTYRIPNFIAVGGAGLALALHALLPAGTGLAGASPGALGPVSSIAGLLVGLVPMLVLYLFNAVGAGDAKLMGMTGAFLGPTDALGALLATAIAGMALAWACALKAGAVRRMMGNLALIGYSMLARRSGTAAPGFDPGRDAAAKVPYSVAIAAGTATWMAFRHSS